MELLFFLVILGIQFAYQIYQAINKKKQIKKTGNTDLSNTAEKISESDNNYKSPNNTTDENQIHYQDQSVKNLYEQLFGFVEEREEPKEAKKSSSPNFSTGLDSSITNSPTSDYIIYENIAQNTSKNTEETPFSYDNLFEPEIKEPGSDSEPRKATTELSIPTSQVSIKKDISINHPHSILTHLSLQQRIKRQLRNPQTFKDNWRIKFILDRPDGLTVSRNLFQKFF